jgi:energy-coupling factor transporter ATP-binding protein EcfA2
MDDRVDRHCEAIRRCNQRGGRMLSLVDLVHAGTLEEELAAVSLAILSRGASLLVGAGPGGAGKTTVMGALLGLLPPDVDLQAADSPSTIRHGLAHPTPRCCYIAHEIGKGSYYAYLWDEELRDFFHLAEVGHLLAGNLHADTMEELREQVCQTNPVPPEALRHIDLVYFLDARQGLTGLERRIAELWLRADNGEHILLWQAGRVLASPREHRPAVLERLPQARALLTGLLCSGARTIEDVRGFLLANWPATW